ncbi:DUF2716 domain-containing protein [Nonomuraea terrae]|uniref:DUF2716 domain-containing protein n=1 Tax=Nonomuraea terrae TaxID=2530383 RepID=UPI0037BCA3DB
MGTPGPRHGPRPGPRRAGPRPPDPPAGRRGDQKRRAGPATGRPYRAAPQAVPRDGGRRRPHGRRDPDPRRGVRRSDPGRGLGRARRRHRLPGHRRDDRLSSGVPGRVGALGRIPAPLGARLSAGRSRPAPPSRRGRRRDAGRPHGRRLPRDRHRPLVPLDAALCSRPRTRGTAADLRTRARRPVGSLLRTVPLPAEHRHLSGRHGAAASVTWHLGTGHAIAGELDRLVRRGLLACVRPDEPLYFLDWNHQGYRFDPHRVGGPGRPFWPGTAYPDGDYYLYVTADLRLGTFGHPWEESLCVFGADLLAEVEAGLTALLGPVMRRGGRNAGDIWTIGPDGVTRVRP